MANPEAPIDWRTTLAVPEDWKGKDITKNKLAHAYKLATDRLCPPHLQDSSRLECKQRLQKAFLVAWMEFEANGGNGVF